MELIGTIQKADDSTDYITVQGASYETARAALEAAVPEGTKLIAIRTDS